MRGARVTSTTKNFFHFALPYSNFFLFSSPTRDHTTTQIAILVAAFAAVAQAGVVLRQGVPGQLIESGSSQVARSEDVSPN